jgi:hypothetical protein
MIHRRVKTNPAFTLALEAVANLWEDAFVKLENSSGLQGIRTYSEIKRRSIHEKGAAFYGSFLPLREQMIALLVDSYRRYFKLALAHPSQTGGDPTTWAGVQLEPAVHAALEWMRDWYTLACDGESRRLRHIASLPFEPGKTVPIPIPTKQKEQKSTWRAPPWLFHASLASIAIGAVKPEHVPNRESTETGPSHTRLILKGAKRMFLRNLNVAIERVRNEEIAAAGAIRVDARDGNGRRLNKRKGWEQREKLYDVMRTILAANPNLQGINFCGELDKRHAEPLQDWTDRREWREGLTWKEAWKIPKLCRKIRRVRQEAQKKS